jgi:RNA polymerase sigma factor FliA
MENWQEELVIDHEYLVERIAKQVVRKTGYTGEKGELHQAGRVGLVEAALRFDPTLGNRFITFAWPRISGAMYTYVRGDRLMRVPPIRLAPALRERLAALARARARLRQGRDPEPTAEQLAIALARPVAEIEELLPQLAQLEAAQERWRITPLDLEERPIAAEGPTPEQAALRHEQQQRKRTLVQALHDCIRALPFEHMATLILCDLGRISAQQATQIMDRTPAHVSLLRRQARHQVRACLIQKGWRVEDVEGIDGLRGAEADEHC